jgi:hypothetical protein
MGQFLPADHSKGDANTVGGYTAVHSRPPAFEGKDGSSYSAEVMADETGDAAQPWGGYLLFVRWRHGDPVATGHLETGFLSYGTSEQEVIASVGAMQLNDAVAELNRMIDAADAPGRRWWESMQDEGDA